MEPSEKPLVSSLRKVGNPDEPASDYEREMFESMDAALHLLEPIMAMMAARGHNSTEARSRGWMLAMTQILAIRLIEHTANMELPIENVGRELDTLIANINLIIEDNYERVLAEVIQIAAQGATKQ